MGRFEAGEIFRQYRIIRELGRGAHATVYLGVQMETGHRVAVKVMHLDSERFERETALLQKLHSPHIVQLHEFGRSDAGEQFLISEWVDGESLREHVARRGAIGALETIDIIRQVLDALCVAHETGVVHRDIKPENTMVTDSGVVKVLDFGIAKLVEGSTLTDAGAVVGTPRYIAPEVIRGGRATPAADVFGVGLLAYFMLTGQHANDRDGIEESLARQLDPEPYRVPLDIEVPAAWRSWIEALLQKQPDLRPADARRAKAVMPSKPPTASLKVLAQDAERLAAAGSTPAESGADPGWDAVTVKGAAAASLPPGSGDTLPAAAVSPTYPPLGSGDTLPQPVCDTQPPLVPASEDPTLMADFALPPELSKPIKKPAPRAEPNREVTHGTHVRPIEKPRAGGNGLALRAIGVLLVFAALVVLVVMLATRA